MVIATVMVIPGSALKLIDQFVPGQTFLGKCAMLGSEN